MYGQISNTAGTNCGAPRRKADAPNDLACGPGATLAQSLIDHVVHVVYSTLEVTDSHVAKRTIGRAHGQHFGRDLNGSHDCDSLVARNFTRPFDAQHALVDKVHGLEQRLFFGRGTSQRIIAAEDGDIDTFHAGLLLGRAGQAHQYSVDALLGSKGGGTQAAGLFLADLQALPDRFAVGEMPRRFSAQLRLGGFSLAAQGLELAGMPARLFDRLLLRGLFARDLVAQGIALLFEAGDAGLQRDTVGLHPLDELHQLPDTGREGIEILQHGRYRKPSRIKLERGKEGKPSNKGKSGFSAGIGSITMQHLRLAGDKADMQVRNKQDFGAGVMFAVIGALASLGALKYDMGTARDMGPGYFPFWLGICLAVLGASIALRALSVRAPISKLDPTDWKTVAILLGSVALSAALLNILGIFLTVFILVLLSSMASHLFNWKVAAITGAGLAVFVWLAFIKALGLVFPLWPSVLSQ